MADETEEIEEIQPPKKSPVMLIVIVLNFLLAAGAVGYALTRGGGDAASAAERPGAAETGGPTGGPIDPSTFATAEMKPFIVNLAGDDGNRYLKVAITARLRDEEARDRFGLVAPAVRDKFIQYLTSLSFEDILAAEKKMAIKKDLVAAANEVMYRGDVLDVYFTEFVIQ